MSETSKRAHLRAATQNIKKLTTAYEHHAIHKLNRQHFEMMQTPKALQLIGVQDLPLYMDGAILKKVMTIKHAKQIDAEIITKLPYAISDPIMIFRAKDVEGNYDPNRCVVVTDLKDKMGGTIIIPIIQNVLSDDKAKAPVRCNKIMSFYGRSDTRTGKPQYHYFLDRMNNDDLLYINKKRTANWLRRAEAHDGLQVGDSFDLSPIIPDETKLRKFEKSHISDTFQRPLKTETTITQEQQDRLNDIYQAQMDTSRPEKLYRMTIMGILDSFPGDDIPKTALHKAERETIRVLVQKGISKSRIKKILQERSPLCDMRQSKRDLEEIIYKHKKFAR